MTRHNWGCEHQAHDDLNPCNICTQIKSKIEKKMSELDKQSYLLGLADGKENKWISVKDRLPEKCHQDVIISDGKNIGIGHIGTDMKSWFDYFDCVHHAHICHDTVTHWMPLPKPPEDK